MARRPLRGRSTRLSPRGPAGARPGILCRTVSVRSVPRLSEGHCHKQFTAEPSSSRDTCLRWSVSIVRWPDMARPGRPAHDTPEEVRIVWLDVHAVKRLVITRLLNSVAEHRQRRQRRNKLFLDVLAVKMTSSLMLVWPWGGRRGTLVLGVLGWDPGHIAVTFLPSNRPQAYWTSRGLFLTPECESATTTKHIFQVNIPRAAHALTAVSLQLCEDTQPPSVQQPLAVSRGPAHAGQTCPRRGRVGGELSGFTYEQTEKE